MEWIPESYPRAGGLAAAGFYKLLGRPRLDPLTVLVRETAQNSWDARLDNRNPVDFTLQGWYQSADEREALRSEVFVGAEKATGTNLDRELASRKLIGLYITDRNTKGLSGPLEADEADPDGTYDWVDFVLNVGKANTQAHTGGTYGFGKTISYVVSAANAVVIHSKTQYRGRGQTRSSLARSARSSPGTDVYIQVDTGGASVLRTSASSDGSRCGPACSAYRNAKLRAGRYWHQHPDNRSRSRGAYARAGYALHRRVRCVAPLAEALAA